MPSLSEATAIRLFNSVVATTEDVGVSVPLSSTITTPVEPTENNNITLSSYDFDNSCRICRWNRSDMAILRCPCLCKGSVGFVHLQCLRRWIMHRRDGRCEICNVPFDMPEEHLNVRRMIKSFMCFRCFGNIAKNLLYSASLLPLSYVVLQQVLITMEKLNVNPTDQFGVHEVIIASCALLTSSALFFHIFEFITTRFLQIRNIFRQWWHFGNTSQFSLFEVSTESFQSF